jgi:hypothetical protein
MFTIRCLSTGPTHWWIHNPLLCSAIVLVDRDAHIRLRAEAVVVRRDAILTRSNSGIYPKRAAALTIILTLEMKAIKA